MPLLRVLHSLPAFSKQTRQISEHAQALRQALREARSPDELLFERLPVACGLLPFRADEPAGEARVDLFAAMLREGLQELQDAYPRLVRVIAASLSRAFDLRASGTGARAELQARHTLIADTTNDTHIRSLGVRLETADPDGDAWVESLAALVVRRPPELWSDGDLPAFEVAIVDLGRRFRAAEELAVAGHAVPAEAPLLRVGLTNGHGELSRIFHMTSSDPAVQRLRADLNDALGRHAGLTNDQRAAALATLLQTLLEE